MSFEAIQTSIQEHLVDNISEVPSSQIAWDNVKFTPTTETPWIRVSIQNNNIGGDIASIGGPYVKIRRIGIVFVQVFIPSGTGTKAANDICDDIASVLEATSLKNGLRFKSASKIESGNSDGWYQVNVSVPFEYDQSRLTTVIRRDIPVITAPTEGQELIGGAVFTILGTSPDDTAIEVFVDDVKVGDAVVSSGSFSYDWTPPTVASVGTVLHVVGNLSGTSAPITVGIVLADDTIIALNPDVMLDFTKHSTMYQDEARTIPVSSTGDPIAAIVCQSTGLVYAITSGQTTTRPLATDNGAEFDGVNDALELSGFASAIAAPYTIIAAMKGIGTSGGNLYRLCNSVGSYSPRIQRGSGPAAGKTQVSSGYALFETPTDTSNHIFELYLDASNTSEVRLDGVVQTLAHNGVNYNLDGLTFGKHPAYPTGLCDNYELQKVFVISGSLTDEQRALVEEWIDDQGVIS